MVLWPDTVVAWATVLAAPMVNSTGAVSPAARATASMLPDTRPGSAVGSTTRTVVFQVRAPRAALPSRRASGTSRSISSLERTTMGSMRQASASEAANAERPWPNSSTHRV